MRVAGSRSGPAGELFERICADHVLVVSLELLAELGRVLTYDRVRRMHKLNDTEVRAFIESLESGGTLVRLPTPILRVVPHDPDDDAVVAAAVVGQAEVLCTRNRHFYNTDVVVIAGCMELRSWTTFRLLKLSPCGKMSKG